jgi:hypothetical protein
MWFSNPCVTAQGAGIIVAQSWFKMSFEREECLVSDAWDSSSHAVQWRDSSQSQAWKELAERVNAS